MPAYKDDERGTWYCKFYYKDWTGKSRQKKKRGFKRERDAKEWERNFLSRFQAGSDIMFSTLIDNYMDDLGSRLKPTTLENKRNIIEKKLLPCFGNLKINEIDTLAIRHWQNELLDYRDSDGNPYSETYLRSMNNQLSAILNYAVTYYNLPSNPCHKIESIGKQNADSMKIWTLDQYERFIEHESKSAGRLAFNILFWTGIREGELLALTIEDFLVTGPNEYKLDINKNYAIVKGVSYYLTPKTEASERCISIPRFLYDEATDYYSSLYDPNPEDRLFYFKKSYLQHEMVRVSKLTGLEKIRVHDLRHSHASLMIEMGFNILMVSKRLGHEKVETTWQTYAHLYPDKEKMLVSQLDSVKIHGITAKVQVEDQLAQFMDYFQKHLSEQPARIELADDEIICWDPDRKEKTDIGKEEFESLAQTGFGLDFGLATAELVENGFLELGGLVYCLASRGMPVRFL